MVSGLLPNPQGTENYTVTPFKFTEEYSSKNVYLRLPDSFSPLERMILQSNGNLQRILSAYYNVPSQVKIIYNNNISPKEAPVKRYDRKIEMYFNGTFAYDAESILTVKDNSTIDLIEKHKYGLGQIFGHAHRQPDFVLHSIGRNGDKPGASFWRDYSLIIPGVLDCFIRETFVKDLFDTYTGDTNIGFIWREIKD